MQALNHLLEPVKSLVHCGQELLLEAAQGQRLLVMLCLLFPQVLFYIGVFCEVFRFGGKSICGRLAELLKRLLIIVERSGSLNQLFRYLLSQIFPLQGAKSFLGCHQALFSVGQLAVGLFVVHLGFYVLQEVHIDQAERRITHYCLITQHCGLGFAHLQVGKHDRSEFFL